MVCKVGQVPFLQSLGSEDFWEFPSPNGSSWCRESSCRAELCKAGVQSGETRPPHTAMILSTKQPGNGGAWSGYRPVFRTGKV